MSLKIVGLGPGDIDDLTRKAWRVLKGAETVFLRTNQHGCVSCLPQGDTIYHNFDALYDGSGDLDTVHDTVAAKVLDAAQDEDIVYAVPGDPMVGEATTRRILAGAQERGIDVAVISGVSFIEAALALVVEQDAVDGLQILDGLEVATRHHPAINPDLPALIAHVYNRVVMADVKATLLNQYPPTFMVQLIHAPGTESAVVESLPLEAVESSEKTGPMTTLYVPALGEMSGFEQFQEIIAHLRAPEGCPWDREQTHMSLRQYLLEEAYEVLEAIDQDNPVELYKELGDVLLQVVLHTQIAIDHGEFMMSDVLRHVNAKMVRRHPHVFATVEVENADEVVVNWDAIKAQEKAAEGKSAQNGKPESLLDSIPNALPALLWSLQAQRRAARVGFDWDQIDDVRTKIDEELNEILEATTEEARAEEFGDFLFVLVNWARWLKIDPENALRAANSKFYRRFSYVEDRVRETGKAMTEFTLDELDVFWRDAKKQERS